jgi:hypothetical protein
MDHSITLVTPAMNRQRGADAFDRGAGIDDHNMNPGAPAIEDWRKGWLERRAAVHAAALIKHLAGVGTPP